MMTDKNTDHVLNGTNFAVPIKSMAVSQDSTSGEFEAFVLSEDSVLQVKGDRPPITLGTIDTQGDFKPTSNAQSSVYINGNNWGNINIHNHYNLNYNINQAQSYSQASLYGIYGGGYGGYYSYYPSLCARAWWC